MSSFQRFYKVTVPLPILRGFLDQSDTVKIRRAATAGPPGFSP